MEANSEKRHIHIGGDFKDLVTKSTTFVDKSLFIKEVIEENSKVLQLTMPRCSGKLINLDMLRRFLSIEEQNPKEKQINKKIFTEEIKQTENGKTLLDISKSEIRKGQKTVKALELQGTYPVIYIDMKDCKGQNFKELKQSLNKKIIETIEKYSYLAQNKKTSRFSPNFDKRYYEILNKAKTGRFSLAILDLSQLLYRYHEKRVWILIDEYDTPISSAHMSFSQEDIKSVSYLFSGVYGSALKDNEYLHQGVITGDLQVVGCGLIPELNNLMKHNVDSIKYSKFYGITQDEMSQLFKHFGIEDEERRLKIKQWYNGYKSNICSVKTPQYISKYNTLSVVNYLNNQQKGFTSYWEIGSIFQKLINKKTLRNNYLLEKVEDLVNNLNCYDLKIIFGPHDFEILKSIIYNNKKQITSYQSRAIFSYLFNVGFLTITQKEQVYALPNKEIKIVFQNKLKQYYNHIFNINSHKFTDLTQLLNLVFSQQNNQKIIDILQKEFVPKFTNLIQKLQVHDHQNKQFTVKKVFENQNLMHSFLNNIAIQIVNDTFINQRYITKPDSTKGRADIVLSKNGKGIFIEMKYNKNTDTQELSQSQANEALEKAKTYSELVNNAQTRIFIGCNITAQQKVYFSFDIKMEDDRSIHQ